MSRIAPRSARSTGSIEPVDQPMPFRCPRCQSALVSGFIDAGKGPLRWVMRPKENLWIFGGRRMAKRSNAFWGRTVAPGRICTHCGLALFEVLSA